jgi:GDPmannose 4,6-dehydratase
VKTALITGICGQDGSFLAELLLAKGYTVHGIKRRSSSFNTGRIDHLMENERFTLHFGDVCDGSSLMRIITQTQPDEVYNLAAQSHVRVSFDTPEYTAEATGLGALKLFETLRSIGSEARVYQASSSEMYGSIPGPQSETTPFYPRSPYASAKAFAHHSAVNYRESYSMHVSCGILFNHESERRGETFVTRKVAMAAARIAMGLQDTLALGNLEARRDWGYAPEYVEAMWRMLQQDRPGDYVIGTGESHTVRELVNVAFERVGLNWTKYVSIDPRYYRPAEVDDLRADPSNAERSLGWKAKTSFAELVGRMVDAELATLRRYPVAA